MGEESILTKEQQAILNEAAENEPIFSKFYFSGGTALSEFYLKHRESIDLDFFSSQQFDPQVPSQFLYKLSKRSGFMIKPSFVDPVYIFVLTFKNSKKLKVDFTYYPYKRLEKGEKFGNLQIDSLFDIAVNKLLLLTQRNEVKDFVDLFFLLKKYSLWDLVEGVKRKFNVEIDPLILASDLLTVEEKNYLPKMLKPLKLSYLKDFYREKARSLGKMVVE